MGYRLVRICAVLAVLAVGLWTTVLMQVTATNGVSVQGLLHCAQFVSFIAFAGGFAVALWHLLLVIQEGGWIAKLYAIALTAAFAVMFWISLSYHLIGISGNF